MKRLDFFTVVVIVLGCAYALAELSPSSYGIVLDVLGAGRAGLVAGEPQGIRADEWGIWTPYIRTTVNNGFARINATSYYGEDLRNFFGMPLADWAIVFKPYFWPFFLVEPALAFSCYHAFFIAACLIGYHLLFRRLGFRAAESVPLSIAIFFSTYFQAWWTTYLQIVAGYPWILLIVMARIRPWVKAAALAWAVPAWLLAHLYPPLHVSLALVGLATVVAWSRESLRWREISRWAGGPALGCAIVVAYLWDVIPVMAATAYPGHRVNSPGGGTLMQWLAQALPYTATSRYLHLTNTNICEVSTLGTHLPALALWFLDWREAFRSLRTDRALRIGTLVLLAVVLLTSAWILLPLPSALGWPLLWHQVPAKRMWLACGLALTMLTLRLLGAAPLRIDGMRFCGFAGCVIVAWLAWEPHALRQITPGSVAELAILAPVAVIVLLSRRLGHDALAALALACALVNAAGFGLFNPLQRSGPIFEKPRTAVVERLDAYASAHPRGLLVLDSYPSFGAALTALGYRTPLHTLLAPRLDVFGGLYPELEPAELDRVFNRFHHVELSADTRPELTAEDSVSIPAEVLLPPEIATTVLADAVERGFRGGGKIESRRVVRQGSRSHVLLQGWAPLDMGASGSVLQVVAAFPVTRVLAFPVLRHDVATAYHDASLAFSGFAMRVELPPGELDAEALCLIAVGRDGRSTLLVEQPLNRRCSRLLAF